MHEVFSFVDASHLITKAALYKERDAAIKKTQEKLNNDILPKVAHDKQARMGCKGKLEVRVWIQEARLCG